METADYLTVEQPEPKRGIEQGVLDQHQIACADTNMLLKHFDEVHGSLVFEIGCHDESAEATHMMAMNGFRVMGFDLRTPDKWSGQGFPYFRWDFANLPSDFLSEYLGRVDAIFAISVLEHFGLGTYLEGRSSELYDAFAVRQAWQLLRQGGTMYITVPFRNSFAVAYGDGLVHWRWYDPFAVRTRLIQDFSVDKMEFFFSDDLEWAGKEWKKGDVITKELAECYEEKSPALSIFLKLRKTPTFKVAPDGR